MHNLEPQWRGPWGCSYSKTGPAVQLWEVFHLPLCSTRRMCNHGSQYQTKASCLYAGTTAPVHGRGPQFHSHQRGNVTSIVLFQLFSVPVALSTWLCLCLRQSTLGCVQQTKAIALYLLEFLIWGKLIEGTDGYEFCLLLFHDQASGWPFLFIVAFLCSSLARDWPGRNSWKFHIIFETWWY